MAEFDPKTARKVPGIGEFDPSTAQPYEPPKPASALRRVGDLGVKAAQGVAAGIPEMVIGAGSMLTGGKTGYVAQSLGFDTKKIREGIGQYLTPEQQAAEKAVQQAEGFVPTLKAVVQNPMAAVGAVAESIPVMVAGGVLGRAVAPGRFAGAVGEGAAMAGSQAEQIRQQTSDGLLTGKQSLIAAGTGLVGGALGAVGSKVAGRFGVGDVDSMIANGFKTGTQAAVKPGVRGLAERMVKGGISEGLFEEMPQSMVETGLQNYALGKDVTDGMGNAAAMGLVTGGLMGAGAGALTRGAKETPPADPTQPPMDPTQPAQGPQGEVLGLPAPAIVVGSDGTAQTAADRNARLQRLQSGDIVDVTPIRETVRPSVAMGINPADGPLSKAAAMAVDSGASPVVDPLTDAPVVQARNAQPQGVDPQALSSMSDADLRGYMRNAQDTSIRKAVSAELAKRKQAAVDAMPDPLQASVFDQPQGATNRGIETDQTQQAETQREAQDATRQGIGAGLTNPIVQGAQDDRIEATGVQRTDDRGNRDGRGDAGTSLPAGMGDAAAPDRRLAAADAELDTQGDAGDRPAGRTTGNPASLTPGNFTAQPTARMGEMTRATAGPGFTAADVMRPAASAEPITATNGDPFPSQLAAKRELNKQGLTNTHAITPAGEGFVLTPNNVQDQQKGTDGILSAETPQAAPVEAPAPAGGNAATSAGVPAAGGDAGVRSDGVDDLGPNTFAGSIKREIEARSAKDASKAKARKPSPPAEAQPEAVDSEVYRATSDGAGKFTLESDESAIAGNGDATPRKFASDSDALAWAKKNGFKTAATGAGDVQADGVNKPQTKEERQAAIDAETMETRNPAQVAQPTPMKRVSFDTMTLSGPKKVNAKLYELPGYNGPQIAVSEYKTSRGTGYKVYLPKSGTFIHDSNGVTPLKDALEMAVLRIKNARETIGKRSADLSKPQQKIDTPAEPARQSEGNEQVKKPTEPAKTEPFDHAGLKIRQTRTKVGNEVVDGWLVQSPENAEREARGERQIGGDRIVETREQAVKTAEQEVKRAKDERARKDALDREDADRKAATEARKEANRGKTLLERRAEAALDKQIRESSTGDVITRREWVERRVKEGLEPKVTQEDKIKPMSRMQAFRADNRQQAEHDKKVKEAGKKDVYWLGDFEITKTEYDYVQKVKANPPAESKPKPEATPETAPTTAEAENTSGWSEVENGFTSRPVYRYVPDPRIHWATVQNPSNGVYVVEYRIGDKVVSTEELADRLLAVKFHVVAKVKELDAKQASHQDPGEKPEAATKGVVNESLKTAAKNEGTKPSEMRKWLLAEIDKELLNAPDRADFDDAVKRVGEKDAISMYTGSGLLGKNAETGFITFDVPGDGKFKVRNSVRGLLEFRKNISASQGFKDAGQRTVGPEQNDGAQSGSGGKMAAINNMIDEGDFEAARDYAEAVEINLDDVKVPRGERKVQWDAFRKDGTLPPPVDTRPLPPQRTPAQIEEEKRQAQEAEEKRPNDTGWNMAGTGYAGKRYRGRNITTDDGRQIVARVYENAGVYEEAEVKVDGVRKFTVTDRNDARGKADAFIKTLTEQEAELDLKGFTRTPKGNGAFELRDGNLIVSVEPTGRDKFQARFGSAKSSPHLQGEQGAVDWADNYRKDGEDDKPKRLAKVTPQISGNPEKFIKVAADSVRELRRQDVDRVLSETPVQFQMEVARHIKDSRKDLADEVDDVMAEMRSGSAKPAPAQIPEGYKPAGEPFYRGGKLTQGYAPFAPGERVTMKEAAGQSGVVESFSSPDDAGVFASAVVKFDNGVEQMVPLGKLQAAAAPAQTPATGTRRDPAKVSMFNPYEDGDIVTIDGQDWTVRQDTPGWYLTNTGNWRGTHPTIRNVKAMADLIRAAEQAAVAQSNPAEPEAETPRLTPAEAAELMEWQSLGTKDGVTRHILTFYESKAKKDAKRGRMTIATITKGDRSATAWMVDGDDKTFGPLALAKKRGMEIGMAKAVSDGFVDATKPAAPAQQEAQKAGDDRAKPEPVAPIAAKVDDFGEKLPPARRAMAAKLSEELTDEAIATQPLSKIWPLEENAAIEDKSAAAVAHVFRDAIPAKPRTSYKVKTWVSRVKMLRDFAASVLSGRLTRDKLISELEKVYSLRGIGAKIRLLEGVDREQWKRIGDVSEAPDAIRYVDGKAVPEPSASVSIDGKTHWLKGSGNLADHMDAINVMLTGDAPESRMQFEVRQEQSGARKVFINKKGDKEYRRLMEFATVEEARKAIKDQYADLVAAWDGIKNRDNITERDLRTAENRPRTGKDHRKGRDISSEEFQSQFGFRGGEFGKWVSQGKGAQERQFMLNSAYDALMDLSDIIGVPPKAISLDGTLGVAFGSRGGGWASAHFEPSNLVINLTKPRGAGALAHEWFHALDNYFARKRGGEAPIGRSLDAQNEYRRNNFITHKTRPMMVRKDGSGSPVTRERMAEWRKSNPLSGYLAEDKWVEDPNHKLGVRAEVEERFNDLVQVLDASPMLKRSRRLEGSKTGDGYWSRTLERAARSFENYIQVRMNEQGYHNDFLVNVKTAPDVQKNIDRYPYLLPSEIAPVADAFSNLFNTIQTKEEDGKTVMFSIDDSTSRADTSDYGTATQAHRDAAARFSAAFGGRLAGGPDPDLLDAVAPRESAKRGRSLASVAAVAERLFNREVVFVRFKGKPKFNGAVSKAAPGFIFLNIDSQKPLMAVLGHELLHEMAKSVPSMYANLSRRLDGLIKGETEYGKRLVDQYRKQGISLKGLDAREELEADIVGDNFMDGEFWNALAEKQPGMFRRIVNFVTQWLDTQVDKLTGYRPFGTDEFLTDIAEARAAVADAMRQFSAAEVGAVADQVDGDVKFSAAKQDQTDTPAFKKWFAGSKVVDAQGKPQVVYHGAPDLRFLKEDGTFKSQKEQLGIGRATGAHWFTPSLATAKTYANPRRAFDYQNAEEGTVATYLKMENPLIVDGGGQNWREAQQRGKTSDVIEEARKGGHDGVIIRNVKDDYNNDKRTRATDTYVVFSSNQIKSATGNAGTFDPDNADIRFSVADRAEQIKQFDVKGASKNTWAHYRGMALQTLGRRQIVDLYAEELPQLETYNELVQRMDADKNEAGAGADGLAQAWGKLDKTTKRPGEEKRLAELMHDATLAQIDPDKVQAAGVLAAQYNALKARFMALSPEAQALYRQARDMYEDHYRQVQDAIKARIERSEMSAGQKRQIMAKMDEDFFKKIKGVYFPLARFGQYVIVVKDSNGEVKNVTRAETLNEAEAARKELLKAFPAQMGNTVGKVLKQAEFNAGRDAVGKGFMADLMNALDEKGVEDELRDTVAQLYLSSLPDLSWAKHGIHRKGTPGFSQDARRAFAQNMFHGARYLAKLRYADQLQDQLSEMQDHVAAYEGVDEYDSVQAQQVVDEMVKRHDLMMNPNSNPVSTALTSFGFLFHMGLSPASAMVNLTQTALVAFPQMGAKWGFSKASAALAKASAETARAKNDLGSVLKDDELAAFNKAVNDGTIDVTMAHDLAGISQGEDQRVVWKIRPVMRAASFLFHHAERFNRQATFIAAYRLAKEANPTRSAEMLYEDAKKATYDGHFDYAASNRPRIMQGNWQKVIFLFKQYGQNMVYSLGRNAYLSMNGLTRDERIQARKALGGLLAAHAAAAGVLGLPLVGPLLTIASMLGGDDDEPWDAEVAMQNALADMLGQTASEVISRGFSRLTPFDLSGRVALNKLILPDVQEGLEGQDWAQATMTAALGPVAGIGVNWARGMQKMTDGDYLRGLEDMMPVALRSLIKSLRYATDGAVDKTGVVITDEVGVLGVAGQAAGFSPSQVRRDTERRSAIYSYDRALMDRRSVLMRVYADARMTGDEEGVADALADIMAFNQKNPTRAIQSKNLFQSVRNRQKRINEAKEGVYLPSKRRDALDAVTF